MAEITITTTNVDCQHLTPSQNLSDYVKIKDLGSGQFGSIYSVKDTSTGHLYAMKRIKRDPAHLDDITNEILILCQLQPQCQPYIVCYEGYFEDKDHIYVMMENLEDYQKLNTMCGQYTPDRQILYLEIILHLVKGLIIIHQQGIAHRDLKPDNILHKDTQVKYIDFGLSCHTPKCPSNRAGTANYLAPETINDPVTNNQGHVNLIDCRTLQQRDIWSLGATIYALITGQSPLQRGLVTYLDMEGISLHTWSSAYSRSQQRDIALKLLTKYFYFPSQNFNLKSKDQDVLNFDVVLKKYSKEKLGHEISITRMLDIDPHARRLF